ncbi:MAG: flagellar basal body P-ring protein FlgI [Verrucomicrobiae bacterium]|nr:flagellar basal body P-ring protein FlgI [Verrucomicrobiae bacterium]
MRFIFSLMLLIFGASQAVAAVRIKDIARIQGCRENQLIGYGVVVGLAGTGDSNPNVTLQTVANFLNRFGVTLAITDIKANNSAIVIVSCDIPPFSRAGSRIDVNVAAIADSKNLQGGVLMQTPLVGADGQVYAVAQGPLILGGFGGGISGAGGSTVQKNHPTTATISNGALIEREIPSELISQTGVLDISLNAPDFTTASLMADALNRRFATCAMAVDSGTVRVQVPPEFLEPRKQVYFISKVENVEHETDMVTRIIINERTGTIVANARIQVSSVAVAHGNLVIGITSSEQVSQPLPFSNTGSTVKTQSVTTTVQEQRSHLIPLPELPTVDLVARALSQLGATPRDMIAIFQCLQQAGALNAEIVVR